jgi:hypothetical protein
MAKCFVIQPFDSGKFDKRFEQVYKPAIAKAGLEAYRVDGDPKTENLIESIEDGIRNAAICLADITTDNPNVWFELGYAFAAGRPVIMVCSEERTGPKYPFDIQHRTIIKYKSEAPQDFEELQKALTDKIKALLDKTEALRQIAEFEQIAPTEGLTQPELIVLAILAGATGLPGQTVRYYQLKYDTERSWLTSIGFSLGFRRLMAKQLIEMVGEWDEDGDSYQAVFLTTSGWNWIERNESLFLLKKKARARIDEPDPGLFLE